VSTLLHDTVYMFSHNLLNVLVQMIANKMGLQENYIVAVARQRQRNRRLYNAVR
jgi:hypothetical protein